MSFRLVVTDMDGTLLDDNHRIPDEFWPLLQKMQERGIVFAPASGRQLATLQHQFAAAGPHLSIIAENGNVVYHDGEIVSLTTVEEATCHAIVDAVQSRPDIDWGLVICRADGAFISRRDQRFRDECDLYYRKLDIVDDPHEVVNEEVVKLAIFCFASAEEVGAPALEGNSGGLPITISGQHWIDLMRPEMNKGIALRRLAEAIGIPVEETLAFGDFLNDYELVKEAGASYAMANGHPKVKAIADHIAPSNAEHGVMRVLEELLG